MGKKNKNKVATEGADNEPAKMHKKFVNSEPWAGNNFSYRPGQELRIGPESEQGAEITEEIAIAREAAGLGKIIEVPFEDETEDEEEEGGGNKES